MVSYKFLAQYIRCYSSVKTPKYNASVDYFCRNLLSFIANRDITKKKLSLRYDDDN